MDSYEFPRENPKYKICAPYAGDYILKTIIEADWFYESDLLEVVSVLPLASGAFIDAGANMGNHSLYFAKVLKRHVFAFEPSSTIGAALLETIEANGITKQVTVVAKGLGRKAEKSILSLNGSNSGMSRIVPKAAQHDAGVYEDVEIDTVDAHLESYKDGIAFIKIDVEGMEQDVLVGAKETIAKFKPLIVLENHVHESMYSMHEFFHAAGYRLVTMAGRSRNFMFCHVDNYERVSDAVQAQRNHVINRDHTYLLEQLKTARHKLESATLEIDRVRALNFGLYKRVATVEARNVDLAARSPTASKVAASKRAQDLKNYKKWAADEKEKNILLNAKINSMAKVLHEVNVKYRDVSGQLSQLKKM